MNGLIKQSIDSLVRTIGGDRAVLAICSACSVPSIEFEQLAMCSDQTTSALINATSEHLAIPHDTLLMKLGYHWINHTAVQRYGELMNIFGNSFAGYVKNLNRMYGYISARDPQLPTPRFLISDEAHSSLTVHYLSSDSRFAVMVQGLLKALSLRFQTHATITHIRSGIRCNHDEFDIAFSDS
jgi:hypothetical protein